MYIPRPIPSRARELPPAHDEQVGLIRQGLSDKFTVRENVWKPADITHYHTVNFRYYLSQPFAKHHGITVGYVHFLPETIDASLKLPLIAKKVFYKYLIAFYKRMDQLVVVNPYFIDRLADYGVDRKKITYIPNFVDERDFYPMDPACKSRLRKKYGLDPKRFTVMCAGQLQRRKGVFDFVECAKRLPEGPVYLGGRILLRPYDRRIRGNQPYAGASAEKLLFPWDHQPGKNERNI